MTNPTTLQQYAEQLLDSVKRYVAAQLEKATTPLQEAIETLRGGQEQLVKAQETAQSSALDTLRAELEEKHAAELADTRAKVASALLKLEERAAAVSQQKGQDGRDALMVDVLPAIDTARSYPPRTYASHNGGLWVSRRHTSGMDGWDCIIEGLAGVEVVQQSERSFTVKTLTASGKASELQMQVPALVYRGSFDEAKSYEKDDAVTWGGSVWIAVKENPGRIGEDHAAWKLAVKRGRDGRDGKQGERGAEGKAGRDGVAKRWE